MALEMGSANVESSTGSLDVRPSTRGRSPIAVRVWVVSSSTLRASKTPSVMRREISSCTAGSSARGATMAT